MWSAMGISKEEEEAAGKRAAYARKTNPLGAGPGSPSRAMSVLGRDGGKWLSINSLPFPRLAGIWPSFLHSFGRACLVSGQDSVERRLAEEEGVVRL